NNNRLKKGRIMRNHALCLLIGAAGLSLGIQAAEVQTRYLGLAASAIYGVREIRQALRCTTTNQCAVQTPRYLNMVGDLHNLYPNEAHLEEQRRADRFGEVADGTPGECGLRAGFKVIEPPAVAKGNVAR